MATMLTLDQMKAFVRNHFDDFVNKRKAAVIQTNMTPDFCDHDGPDGKPTGVEGDERMMVAMYKSMPDLRLEIEDMIAEGDKVMCRNIWRWTDTASGKKCSFMASCSGALKETRSSSVGPRSRRPPRVRNRQGLDEIFKEVAMILVTGASGNAGGAVVKEVLKTKTR